MVIKNKSPLCVKRVFINVHGISISYVSSNVDAGSPSRRNGASNVRKITCVHNKIKTTYISFRNMVLSWNFFFNSGARIIFFYEFLNQVPSENKVCSHMFLKCYVMFKYFFVNDARQSVATLLSEVYFHAVIYGIPSKSYPIN